MEHAGALLDKMSLVLSLLVAWFTLLGAQPAKMLDAKVASKEALFVRQPSVETGEQISGLPPRRCETGVLIGERTGLCGHRDKRGA